MRQRVVPWLIGLLSLAVIVTGSANLDRDVAPRIRVLNDAIEVPGGPTYPGTVRISYALYLPESDRPAPAVIVSPGFGETKEDLRTDALAMAKRGFVTLAWTMRGGNPLAARPGRIALDAPDAEVADLRRLIDLLATRADVVHDGPGDPQVGLMGQSYGGAVSLLAAGYDTRVDALAPVITWNSLESSLLPGGVFKAQYAAVFFAAATVDGCLLLAERVCLAYQRIAQTGYATNADRLLLKRSSPDSVLDRISAPTLLMQGEQDTLFPLSEALRTATRLKSRHVPVQLAWLHGGHDEPFDHSQNVRIRDLTGTWFERHLRDRPVDTGPVFQWDRDNSSPGTASALPPLSPPQQVVLRGESSRQVSNPAGGRPASISSVPGAGDLGGLGSALGLDVPGQSASWETAPLTRSTELVGGGHVDIRVSSSTPSGVLFLTLRDVSATGKVDLPGGAVAPVLLTGLSPRARAFRVDLPVLSHVFPTGHRIRLGVATTDLGYAGPLRPASYEVSLDPRTALALPLMPLGDGRGYRGLATVAGLMLAALLLVAASVRLRRRRRATDLGDDDVPPVVIRGLAKSYASGFRAVDGIDLVVERGMLLGLLGPNGAGKTTTLRMLAGLIRPTEGEVRLFGRPVRSGAAVLGRVGFFVEGPGLLPHLSGTENLRLYWMSTAPSMEGSFVDEALELAGLGDAVDRPVRTYSHGMRQRLAIAQAMLGDPDLLVLDEPTNGLDPPQIKEVREVLKRIAATGRTVLVSSHLLSEVEQMCSHVAVMSRGKMVAQGTVAELLADDGSVRIEVDSADLARAMALVSAMPGVLSVLRSDEALVVELGGRDRSAVVAALVGAGIGVQGVASRRRLEDVFLELLGDLA
ncbi:MAG: transporter related [Frankiales bacterium]|nr:transporter related [Frankiales bacterium]